MAANEVKNLTGRALPHWHVKLFIVFRSTFKEKFLTWVDCLQRGGRSRVQSTAVGQERPLNSACGDEYFMQQIQYRWMPPLAQPPKLNTMADSKLDSVSYVILLRGMSESAYAKFANHFPHHRGGVNPRLKETYHTVPCELSVVGEHLDWIVTGLSPHYRELALGVSIHAPRNWSNFDVPNEVLHATHKYCIPLRISFSSPATPPINSGDD
ncbi:hypothetical protein [Janthinobacterium sp. CG3]|uniref:hypothetical protein n=1 Tax=Janthinobacterium sp. CG3 TaxID=1075768 RepID=UPI0018DED9BE|nr:hypothetical protein [Janthinobacterium sp. CG3]